MLPGPGVERRGRECGWVGVHSEGGLLVVVLLLVALVEALTRALPA